MAVNETARRRVSASAFRLGAAAGMGRHWPRPKFDSHHGGRPTRIRRGDGIDDDRAGSLLQAIFRPEQVPFVQPPFSFSFCSRANHRAIAE
jgi:hypothetical protein